MSHVFYLITFDVGFVLNDFKQNMYLSVRHMYWIYSVARFKK